MARIPLIGQPYQGRSIIASAQRAVNLYAESNAGDPQAPSPFTWYPTPGTVLAAFPLIANERKTRCTYRTSKGTAYVVIGTTVYFLTNVFQLVIVGFIADRTTQVIMADNGNAVVLVDGQNGYAIDMASNTFSIIIDPAFYGADYVLFLDTFFVFNRPATNQFYISLSNASYGMLTNSAITTGSITAGALYTTGSYLAVPLTGGTGTGATADITVAAGGVTAVNIVNPGLDYLVGDTLSADAANIGGTGSGFIYTITAVDTAFDPLDIAAKSGNADPIKALATTHNELWLIGELTSEIWQGTGAADFYFQRVQGAFVNHGCLAPYSVASIDVTNIWVMQDYQGKGIVVKTNGYALEEISTPRIQQFITSGTDPTDAIGCCFQISDHAFYCLILPSKNMTLIYDLTTGFWSEWAWLNENGQLNRHRINCCMFVYGRNIIGDWENGKLFSLEADIYTDDNLPITRIRTFPHIVDDGRRTKYYSFDADMGVATLNEATDDPPLVALSWSDNRGQSYGNPVNQTLGLWGEFNTWPSWNGLGMARDRIFMLQWSAPMKTALNGAFIEMKRMKS